MGRAKTLTKKLKKQIAELVATGLDEKQALAKLGNPVKPNTVYKEVTADPEFASLLSDAWFAQSMLWQAEYREVFNSSPTELFPELEFRDAMAKHKAKMQGLQYLISTVAPRLSERVRNLSAKTPTDTPATTQTPIVLNILSYGNDTHKDIINGTVTTPKLPISDA